MSVGGGELVGAIHHDGHEWLHRVATRAAGRGARRPAASHARAAEARHVRQRDPRGAPAGGVVVFRRLLQALAGARTAATSQRLNAAGPTMVARHLPVEHRLIGAGGTTARAARPVAQALGAEEAVGVTSVVAIRRADEHRSVARHPGMSRAPSWPSRTGHRGRPSHEALARRDGDGKARGGGWDIARPSDFFSNAVGRVQRPRRRRRRSWTRRRPRAACSMASNVQSQCSGRCAEQERCFGRMAGRLRPLTVSITLNELWFRLLDSAARYITRARPEKPSCRTESTGWHCRRAAHTKRGPGGANRRLVAPRLVPVSPSIVGSKRYGGAVGSSSSGWFGYE